MPIRKKTVVLDQVSISEVDMTDEEVIAAYDPHIIFSADRLTVPADGTTRVTITVAMMSVPLSDDTRRPIRGARQLTIIEDGAPLEIDIGEDGRAVLERAYATAGSYEYKADSTHHSVGITIEAQ